MNSSVIGTWELESFEIEAKDTRKRHPWGTNAHGLLIYAPSGRMSVSINKNVEEDPEQSPAENLFDSILFYAGTFQVHGNEIRHQVTEASNPKRIGKEMIRYATFSGSHVELATPEEDFGRAILTWKRIAQ